MKEVPIILSHYPETIIGQVKFSADALKDLPNNIVLSPVFKYNRNNDQIELLEYTVVSLPSLSYGYTKEELYIEPRKINNAIAELEI